MIEIQEAFSKIDLFQYKIEVNILLRCQAGTQLSRMGLRKQKDYRRLDGPKITTDSYWFCDIKYALQFKLWLPEAKYNKSSYCNLLKIIRPRMRNIFLDVLGVQPMMGPMAQIHALRFRYTL